jgi:hypothetical protein
MTHGDSNPNFSEPCECQLWGSYVTLTQILWNRLLRNYKQRGASRKDLFSLVRFQTLPLKYRIK